MDTIIVEDIQGLIRYNHFSRIFVTLTTFGKSPTKQFKAGVLTSLSLKKGFWETNLWLKK